MRIQRLLLILLGIHQIIAEYPNEVFEGCFFDDPADPSFSSAVSVDEVNPRNCSRKCLEFGYSFAAISNGNLCLCSDKELESVEDDSNCASECSNGETGCGGEGSFISVYKTPVDRLENFQFILRDPGPFELLEAVWLQYNGSEEEFVCSVLDYGDETPTPSADFYPTNWDDFMLHVYTFPGNFEFMIACSDEKNDEQTIKELSVYPEIFLPMSIDKESIQCPEKRIVEEEVTCIVTLISGEDVTLKITFEDEEEVIGFPDTTVIRIGNNIPQLKKSGEIIRVGSTGDVILTQNPVRDHGYLKAFEACATEDAIVQFLIITFKCNDPEKSYCPDIGQCKESVDLITGVCDGTSEDGDDDFTVSERYTETINFESDNDFESQTQDNYKSILKTISLVEVFPGDVLAFTVKQGYLYGEKLDEGKVADIKHTSPPQPTNIIHYVSACVVIPASTAVSHVYESAGEKEVMMEFYSSKSEKPWTHETMIKIKSIITGLRIMPDSDYVETETFVGFNTTVRYGENVLYTWNFGDGTVESEQVAGDALIDGFIYRHSYAEAGTYTVNVTAEEDNKEINDSCTVYVQYPLNSSYWFITFFKTKLISPGENISIWLDFNGTRFPTNISATLDWGDEKTEEVSLETEDGDIEQKNGDSVTDAEPKYLEFAHPYTQEGKYEINVNLSNKVSWLTFDIEVQIYIRIKGVEIEMKHLMLSSSEDEEDIREDPLGEKNNEFMVNSLVEFTVTREEGSVTSLNIDLVNATTDDDEDIDSLNNPEIIDLERIVMNFTQAGVYVLEISAANPEQTVRNLLTVIILPDVQEFTVVDFQSITNVTKPKIIEINGTLTNPNICLEVFYDDSSSSENETYGHLDTCNSLFPKANYKGELEYPQLLEHVYNETGNYTVEMKLCCNPKSCYNNSISFEIQFLYCEPNPKAELLINDNVNTARTPSTAIRREKSKPIIVLSTLRLERCVAEATVRRNWNISRVINEDLEQIDTSGLDMDGSTLYIPKLYLPLGIYRIDYSAVITLTVAWQNITDTVFKTDTTIYIEVDKSELIPVMVSGSMAALTRTFGWKEYLNPGGLTVDPDDPENKLGGISVEWFCYRFPEEMSKFSYDNPDKSRIIEVPTSPVDIENDAGGCFGTGYGFLNIAENDWLVDTEYFYSNFTSQYDNKKIFTIIAIIKKDTRMTTVNVSLLLTEEKVPIMRIRCRDVGECFPTKNGILVNNNTRLALIAECIENCPSAELEYQWKIIGNNGKNYTKLDASGYVVGEHFYELAIFPSFFEHFNTFRTFLFQMNTTSNETAPTLCVIRVDINSPPSNPNPPGCSLEETTKPPKNLALASEFLISCKNWMDHEEHSIDRYTFSGLRQISSDSNITKPLEFMLCSSEIPECKVILPCGKLQLFIKIEDHYGGVTTVSLGEFNLDLPSDYKKYTGKSWMEAEEANGDEARQRQIFHALNSIQDCTNDDLALEDAHRINEFLQKAIDSKRYSIEHHMQLVKVVSSCLTDGEEVDRAAKEKILTVLKLVQKEMNDRFDEISFNEVIEINTYIIQILGAVAKSNTMPVMDSYILPSDIEEAETMDYDSAVDPSEIVEASSYDDLEAAAIIRSHKKESKYLTSEFTPLIYNLEDVMFKKMVVNEPSIKIFTPTARAIFVKLTAGGGNNESSMEDNNSAPSRHIHLEVGEGKVELPDVCTLLLHMTNACDLNQPLAAAVIIWDSILQTHGDNVKLLSKTSSTIDINLFTGENSTATSLMDVQNLTEPFSIYIPMRNSNKVNNIDDKSGNNTSKDHDTFVIPKVKWFELMGYHQFTLKNKGSSVSVQFTPKDDSIFYVFYIKHDKKPQLRNYDYFFNPYVEQSINTTDGSLKFFVSNETITNKEGKFYLGVVQLNDSVNRFEIISGDQLTPIMVNNNFTSPYSIKISSFGCYFYDEYQMDWMVKGCYGHNITSSVVHCKCNHLTTFGGGLFVKPNTINFTYVFANASFTDNITIYITIIITLLIFALFLIWARRKDNKDIEKLGALPLPDNDPQHKYYYEILVFTGSDKESSTDSKVSFQLSGDRCETEVRHFGTNSTRKLFRRDNVDVFVIAVPRPLGQLQYLRIWHDNSGKGPYASWYLNYIIFRDVQTGEKFEFICNSWLAVERCDGEIERLLPVARKEDLTEFRHLFQTSSRKNFTDGHLWFSVFLRPPRSRFTRCQRVCSCIALLYLSMLVNAMWYGTVPEKPSTGSLKVGPLNLSLEQISVGFMSNLIVFPPSFLIIFLFRKSRPRHLRPSRITEAIKKQQNGSKINLSLKSTSGVRGEKRKAEQIYERKKRFTLPWWCAIIAWVLCIACIVVSIFFLWAYGIQFGNEKTKKWITSLIISFISSVFITQPIKVFLLAILFSAICKKVETDEDDADEDERNPELNHDEDWLDESSDPTLPKKTVYSSNINPNQLEETRMYRKKEVKMWKILQEIAGYFMLLWILSVIGFSVRDPNAFWLRQNLVKTFAGRGIHENEFINIKTVDDYQTWLAEVFLPNVKVKTYYNNKPALGWANRLKDGVNTVVGTIIIRQVRGVKEDCSYNDTFSKAKFCFKPSQERKSDKRDYGPKWTKTLPKETDALKDVKFYRPFRYSSSELFKTTSLWGRMNAYSGDGYLHDFTHDDNLKDFQYLIKNNWIDSHTKAIFTEFSTYNPQIDMFAVVRLVLESKPGGDFVPFVRINPIRLGNNSDNLGNFVFLCKGIFVIITLWFTIRELYRMFKQGLNYFKQFWNIVELALVFFSHSAIAMHIVRTITLKQILRDAKKGQYLVPVDLPLAQQMDEIYSYCISMAIFLGIIRCNKILRFITRISIIAETIWNCVKQLGGFFVLLTIVMIAYTFLYTILFRSLEDCRSFLWSWHTLVSLSLNRGNFHAFYDYHYILGPIAFFSFAFLFNLILLNVFLSIVLGTFEKVKVDINERASNESISEYMLQRFKMMLGLSRRITIVPKPKSKSEMKSTDKENRHTSDELPEKVNRLLDYINSVYFDGKLELSKKEMMKLYPNRSSKNLTNTQVVFNSD